MAEIAILGAGSWGTALGIQLAGSSGHDVTLWEFRPDAAKALAEDRENREFLPGAPFPDKLAISNDLEDSIAPAEIVLLVVPSQVTRKVLEQIDKKHVTDKIWVGCSKGIENSSLQRMSEVAAAALGEEVLANYIALSGPSHAEEVSLNIPTTVVAAGQDIEVAKRVQHELSNPTFRVYASEDIVGVELGASLKNVIAIATGICDGMGFGDNTRGALITRGLHEITRIGLELGGQRETFAGLSGMGDMITTCTSKHSRNRYVGEQLGKGRKLKEILAQMHMVAEGVATTQSVHDLAAKHNVEMPISEKVYEILFKDADARVAVKDLMTRTLKVEHHL